MTKKNKTTNEVQPYSREYIRARARDWYTYQREKGLTHREALTGTINYIIEKTKLAR